MTNLLLPLTTGCVILTALVWLLAVWNWLH